MDKRMLIDAVHPDETRVAILEGETLYEYDFITASKAQIKGNIYLAKITRVEPSLQAAFVEYGGGKQGFLPFAEIHPDYYQLPIADKQKLLEEQIAEAEAEEAAEEEAFEREQAARESRHGAHRRGQEDNEGFIDETSDAVDDVRESRLDMPPAAETISETVAPDDASSYVEAQAQPLAVTEYTTYSEVLPEQEFVPEMLPEFAPPNAEAFSELPEDIPPLGDDALSGDAPRARFRRPRRGDKSERSDSGERGIRGFHRRYRIQEVIKRNQIVLVQVIKEERGNKGCSLTTYISLAGRYCVLMPNSPKGGGISRKITDRDTRRKLKDVVGGLKAHKGMSVIVRTAGIDRGMPEIQRDYEYLIKLWNQIRETTLASTAPAAIYKESDLIKRSLRDLYTSDIKGITIEGEKAYQQAKEFMQMLMPDHVDEVQLYQDATPLFAQSGVEAQLESMLDPQVRLRSGGYIVINPTEALISIDVNSGRSTTERNVEETAIKTNLEAANEIARQLRLRDLAGLIVIDFIDMGYSRNRRTVERAMKDALKRDRAKIQVARISTFGLMEMSRQRLRPSMAEAMGQPCPHCKGTGYVHSVETMGIQIIRTLQKEAASGLYTTLRVSTYEEAALHLLNEMREMVQSLEQRFQVKVVILVDAGILSGAFRLIKVTSEGKEVLHEDARASNRTAKTRRPRRRGGKERGGDEVSDDDSEENTTATNNVTSEMTGDEVAADAGNPATNESGERPRHPRRERGERGGRRGRRGGRDRHRPRRVGETPEATSGTDQVAAIQTDAPAERVREPRPPRDDRPREPRESREGSATSDSAVPRPPHLRDFKPQGSISAPSYPPSVSQVIPLSEPTSATGSTNEKPKRKGWWNKMLEG
ncbi:MAG: ribonuclease E/G [Alphaproteobacteria bacterium]